MRIVSGKYRGRHFDIPNTFKARPTTDFAKENLFNVLNNILDFDECSALDLFAGTGSISAELLSRGCQQVICIEKDRDHFSFICKVMKTLNAKECIPINTDVFRFIKKCRMQFDFIFADPPYALDNITEIPDIIMRSSLLKPDGLFVLEHGKTNNFSEHPYFSQHRNYGSVNFSFFKYKDNILE